MPDSLLTRVINGVEYDQTGAVVQARAPARHPDGSIVTRKSTRPLPDGRTRETVVDTLGNIISQRILEETHRYEGSNIEPPRATEVERIPVAALSAPARFGAAAPKVTLEQLQDREEFDIFETIDAATGGAARRVDVTINETLGGLPGETISARVGRREGPVQTAIAGGLDSVAPGHTVRAAGFNRWPCVSNEIVRQAVKRWKARGCR